MEYKITKGKNVLNMDESGARVGCPGGENIIVPTDIKELYTASPENRKSVTVIETIHADGREPLPPFVIAPGQKIMDNWISKNLIGTEHIACTPTGYTNNEIAMQYLDHLIKHSHARPEKAWKILLLDGHESHRYQPFQLKAAEYHIKLFYFPSHLTHVLQPLDVGIFRPWKHYHKMAINAALRSLDFEYSITSFFRDLTSIRQQTMQKHTIVNAFASSGMWPVSAKAGIKKMRSYGKRKRSIEEVEADDTLELPALPPTRPQEIWNTAATVRALGDRDPTKFSDGSVQLYHKTMKAVDTQLQKGHLMTIEHNSLQAKLREDYNKKSKSRKSTHKGGASAPVSQLREEIKAKAVKDQAEKLRKAEKKLSQAVSKAKKELNALGIQARKDEKARAEQVREIIAQGDLPPLELLVPIREPDKRPTLLEAAKCTEDFYPELQQVIKELRSQQQPPARLQTPNSDGDSDGDVTIRTEAVTYERDVVGDYLDSSPPPPDYIDSSDVESNAGSIDSIARNADFIAF